MKSICKLMLSVCVLLPFVPGYSSAKPASPGQHPAYLHAVSDLRYVMPTYNVRMAEN